MSEKSLINDFHFLLTFSMCLMILEFPLMHRKSKWKNEVEVMMPQLNSSSILLYPILFNELQRKRNADPDRAQHLIELRHEVDEFGNYTIAEAGCVNLSPGPNHLIASGPFMDQRTASIRFSLAIIWPTRTGRSRSDTNHI
jgi:hypothetical protein